MNWGKDSWDGRLVAAKAPLFDALSAFARQPKTAFNMPAAAEGALPDFCALDVTELSETDDLNEPRGPVLEAQRAAARFFGAAETRLLTEGSSQGIFAALLALAGYGGRVLFPRALHRSFLYAAQRFNLDVFFALPLDAKTNARPGPEGAAPLLAPSPEDYERVLRSETGIQLMVATAPDYYGFIPDLEALERLARRYHCALLIDAAHGAHLHAFAGWRLYGDVVVESAHKTLPALTPAAFLHVCAQGAAAGLAERLDCALQTLRSSSPPLFLAASCDWARAFLELYGGAAAQAQQSALRDLAAALPDGLRLLNPPARVRGLGVGTGADPLRLVLDVSYYMSGPDFLRRLAERGIYAEFADQRRVVLIPSLLFSAAEYGRLAAALTAVVEGCDAQPAERRARLLACDRRTYAYLSGLHLGERHALAGGDLHAALQRRLAGRAQADDGPELIYPPGIALRWPTETAWNEEEESAWLDGKA